TPSVDRKQSLQYQLGGKGEGIVATGQGVMGTGGKGLDVMFGVPSMGAASDILMAAIFRRPIPLTGQWGAKIKEDTEVMAWRSQLVQDIVDSFVSSFSQSLLKDVLSHLPVVSRSQCVLGVYSPAYTLSLVNNTPSTPSTTDDIIGMTAHLPTLPWMLGGQEGEGERERDTADVCSVCHPANRLAFLARAEGTVWSTDMPPQFREALSDAMHTHKASLAIRSQYDERLNSLSYLQTQDITSVSVTRHGLTVRVRWVGGMLFVFGGVEASKRKERGTETRMCAYVARNMRMLHHQLV
ncbi:hypothetical protein KIPB_007469, partial [Kipferlia bialata]